MSLLDMIAHQKTQGKIFNEMHSFYEVMRELQEKRKEMGDDEKVDSEKEALASGNSRNLHFLSSR